MSHLYIKTETVKGWREAMADWGSGGDAALAEVFVVTTLDKFTKERDAIRKLLKGGL